MNQSLKAIIQLVALVCVLVSAGVWTMPRHPDATVWICRFVFPLASLAIGYFLFRLDRKKDLAPDFLRAQFGGFFERDGLCFMPDVRAQQDDGVCWIDIYFQNRYSGNCVCDLIIQPPVKTLGIRRHKVPTIAIEIVCPGGAFGVTRVPYPINSDYQGRKMAYEVAARTQYPNGAGKMLRFRDGMRVGKHEHQVGRAAVTLGLAAVGVISISSPAKFTIVLPKKVSESLPPEVTESTEILWHYDAPTGGFPVDLTRKQ